MEGKQHGDVVSAIKAGGDEAKLLVVDKETDEFFKKCRVIPSSEHLKGEPGDRLIDSCWRPGRTPMSIGGGQSRDGCLGEERDPARGEEAGITGRLL